MIRQDRRTLYLYPELFINLNVGQIVQPVHDLSFDPGDNIFKPVLGLYPAGLQGIYPCSDAGQCTGTAQTKKEKADRMS